MLKIDWVGAEVTVPADECYTECHWMRSRKPTCALERVSRVAVLEALARSPQSEYASYCP